MKRKNKFFKILLWIISILLIIAALVIILGYSYLKFFIIPKLNANTTEIADKITVSDLTKEFSDKQIIDNIINFDKESASQMLTVITELEEEIKAENPEIDSKNGNKNNNEKTQEKPVSKEGTTAYQRILNEASKDEISLGTSIISKISMAKVNELRKSGDTAALKAYIKSVLSPSEISEALKLYNKYKHLL